MLLYLENLWALFVDMSYYIVIGLIFTGLLHAFVKKDVILTHIGKDTTGSVVKASVLGVPLPLCSCGVVPTAMYLGKSGASKGAVVSFLTSTPQTGIDSLTATYGMMGGLFAVYRAVAAFLSGIISGIVTNILCKNDKINYDTKTSSCCSHEVEKVDMPSCCSSHGHEEANEVSSCGCSHEHQEQQQEHDCFGCKIKKAFTYAFGEFLDEIAFHFVIGLLIAALISTLLPTSILSNFNNPIVTMLLMVIIGIPMYICSTASIPIAVSLMMKGISPGSAFVFLFAGPVTNIASLTILIQTLGKKVTAIYLACAGLCAIGFGIALDYIIEMTNYTGISDMLSHSHAHEIPAYMTITAVVFGILVLKSLLKHFTKKSSANCCEHSH